MASDSSSAPPPPRAYWSATRHPWPCLLFLLPLLAAYEGGVLWLGGKHPEALRNGADTWLRWGLEAFGLQQLYWAPGAVVLILLGWSWVRRDDRPGDVLGVCSGMAIESVLGALVLWGLSRGFGPLLDYLGIELAVATPTDVALAQLVTFVGAGLYEEVLFRLWLFWGLVGLSRLLDLPAAVGLVAAAALAALAFSAAHHVGPYGEAFEPYVFLFRTLAGFYFTLLFLCRGIGVAVGAHVCYDVLVGMAIG